MNFIKDLLSKTASARVFLFCVLWLVVLLGLPTLVMSLALGATFAVLVTSGVIWLFPYLEEFYKHGTLDIKSMFNDVLGKGGEEEEGTVPTLLTSTAEEETSDELGESEQQAEPAAVGSEH